MFLVQIQKLYIYIVYSFQIPDYAIWELFNIIALLFVKIHSGIIDFYADTTVCILLLGVWTPAYLPQCHKCARFTISGLILNQNSEIKKSVDANW